VGIQKEQAHGSVWHSMLESELSDRCCQTDSVACSTAGRVIEPADEPDLNSSICAPSLTCLSTYPRMRLAQDTTRLVSAQRMRLLAHLAEVVHSPGGLSPETAGSLA